MSNFRILPAGDRAFVVEFGDVISRAVNAKALELDARLATAAPPGIIETVPTFRSLLICFDPSICSPEKLFAAVARLAEAQNETSVETRRWRVPVCYQPPYAIDLEDIARYADVSTNDVASIHAALPQHISMLGFLPGQPYLGDLNDILALPRRRSPRPKVAAGSVGIAGRMTCVFPRETPCGLNVIGRCPLALSQSQGRPRFLLSPGDQVIFEPISVREFDLLSQSPAGDASAFERYQIS